MSQSGFDTGGSLSPSVLGGRNSDGGLSIGLMKLATWAPLSADWWLLRVSFSVTRRKAIPREVAADAILEFRQE